MIVNIHGFLLSEVIGLSFLLAKVRQMGGGSVFSKWN